MCAGLALASGVVSAETAKPLSAIDWLSESVTAPVVTANRPKPTTEPPVANTATSPSVSVTALDAPSADPIGILPPEMTGLPKTLWAGSDAKTLATLVASQPVDGMPAAQQLLRHLILAQADAPLAGGSDSALFLARIDKLLDIGALEPALEMLTQVDSKTPQVFRRWFDVALLTGAEDEACEYMRDTPSTAPTSTTRIFCLARNGDWPAAALTLNTQVALGDISDADADLLSRFLDPDLYEGEAALPQPDRVSPLVFRMREAIGEPLPTARLPRAFAHADLRHTVGWKSQLEAAERLARSGAIDPNALHGFYLARKPAASGGVWDRVAAVQRLDTAITSASKNAVIAALPDAWNALSAARTEVAFATLFGTRLAAIAPNDPIVAKLALLSPEYESYAQALSTPDFTATVALGAPEGATSELEKAIEQAFRDAKPDPQLLTLAEQGKLGEALLQSLGSFHTATHDMVTLTEILAFWRSVGLEDLARRASLQRLILERPQ